MYCMVAVCLMHVSLDSKVYTEKDLENFKNRAITEHFLDFFDRKFDERNDLISNFRKTANLENIFVFKSILEIASNPFIRAIDSFGDSSKDARFVDLDSVFLPDDKKERSKLEDMVKKSNIFVKTVSVSTS